MVGEGLPVFTVVGAPSCPIPDWLAPLQARNSQGTRRIVKPVAGLMRFDFFVGCHWAANSWWDWLSVAFVLVCAMSTIDNLGLGLGIYENRPCATLGVI